MRNENTWHFKLPDLLLRPRVDRWAKAQGFETLRKSEILFLLSLFQTFSAYANLPLGLNPQQSRLLRKEFQRIKNDPNMTTTDMKIFVRNIKKTKAEYDKNRNIAQQKDFPVFTAYKNEDLLYLSKEILERIEIYCYNAKMQLKYSRMPQQAHHLLQIFSHFIETTETRLRRHQQNIALCMLLRLKAVESTYTINHWSRQEFTYFHAYVAQYGHRDALERLPWISNNVVSLNAIIKPQKSRWPRWLFRGRHIAHQAFDDAYHLVSLSLKAEQLKSLNLNNPKQYSRVDNIHRSLNHEIQRLNKLRKKLFRLFHRNTLKRIDKQLEQLSAQRQEASRLKQRLQRQIADIEAKERRKQMRRAAIQTRSDQHNAQTQMNLEQSCEQLTGRLRNLLQQKTLLSSYLEIFNELKLLSEQLPCLHECTTIKRLCAVGPTIRVILNELPNAILDFANGEIECIPQINPLLLDIIDADLIAPNKKEVLLQLIDATLLDLENSLPTSEKQRLMSVKKVLNGSVDENDRAAFINQLSLNPHRLIANETSTHHQHEGDTTDATTIPNFH